MYRASTSPETVSYTHLDVYKRQAVYMAEPVADFIAVSFTAILFTFQFKKALAAISSKEEDKTLSPNKKDLK